MAGIFAAKGRPSDHPLIVHVRPDAAPRPRASRRRVPAVAQRLMHAFWPGPLTLILPRLAGQGEAAAGGQDTIGLRCPAHPVAHALLLAGRQAVPPVRLAAPSANRFGRVSPTTAQHVAGEFSADLLVLDGGATPVGIESAIVDCTRGAPVLLRPGTLTREQIEAACGERLRLPHEVDGAAPRASGTLESHYAPNARVRLMDGRSLQTALDVLGPDAAGIAVYARGGAHPRARAHAADAGRPGRDRAAALCGAARPGHGRRQADLGRDAARHPRVGGRAGPPGAGLRPAEPATYRAFTRRSLNSPVSSREIIHGNSKWLRRRPGCWPSAPRPSCCRLWRRHHRVRLQPLARRHLR